jgi:probable addiction module antidote protein
MVLRYDTVMNDQELLNRITLNPAVLMGKPIVRGTRLSVEFILGLLAHGATMAEILEEYDGLTADDIKACILFAGQSLSHAEFMPLEMAAYLEACLEEANGDAAFVAKALGNIARAKGVTEIARETGLSRESLYKSLSGERSPSFETVLKVIGALGLKVHAEPA